MSTADPTPEHQVEFETNSIGLIRALIQSIDLKPGITRFRLEIDSETPVVNEDILTGLATPDAQAQDQQQEQTTETTEAVETDDSPTGDDDTQTGEQDEETEQERYERQRQTTTDDFEQATETVETDDSPTGDDDQDDTPDDLTQLTPEQFEDRLEEIDDEDDTDEDDYQNSCVCGETFTDRDRYHGHVGNCTDYLDRERDRAADTNDVTVTVYGDTDQWDVKKPSEEYLDKLDNGEDVNPEELVPRAITTDSAKWKVLGLLARSNSRLQVGQVHKMLENTEWGITYSSAGNSLYELKKDGLIEADESGQNYTYAVTQLGLDYVTVKNSTTKGHDLAVADRITNRSTDDTTQATAQ